MKHSIKSVKNENDEIHLTFKLNHKQETNEMYGFNPQLNMYRNSIDTIHSETWKKVRWYINNYDFLVKDPIINRAFYKYWEIIHEFNIFENFDIKNDVIFHCAEAPGGFIQGTNIYLKFLIVKPEKLQPIVDSDGFTSVPKKKKPEIPRKVIYTISLNKDIPKYHSFNLPSYNKNVITKQVSIIYGKDNTGDINNLENLENVEQIINKKVFLITADGGFDEGIDFNYKEQLHYTLILNEIYGALLLQELGGSFILKVFDIFTETSIHLLYLLNIHYSEIYVYKPKTSRPSNSERYIICKGFLGTSENLLKNIANLSKCLLNVKFVSFTIFKTISPQFIQNIKKINNIMTNSQCICLEIAIKLCNDTKFIENYENELSFNLENRKTIFNEWSKKYNLE